MPKASLNGKVLADSEATEQVEGNHYFPRADVAMDGFKISDTAYTCPWKGKAEYYHIEVGGETHRDAAWSYPDPKEAAKNIAGHIAFDRSKGIEIA